MFPILLDWGAVILPAWHTFYVLGALAALALLLGLGARFAPDIPRHDLARLFAVCYLGGYVGARLLSIVIEEPDVQGFGATLAALLRFGPMTFYGGALVGGLAGAVFALARQLPVGRLVDLAVPAGLVALAFGRIGCFLNGDDYGRAAPLGPDGQPPAWAVTFPVLEDGIARYPVQLMEAGAATALAGLLIWAWRRRAAAPSPGRAGFIGFLGIVGYANLRFALEFLRDDFRGFVFGTWLSTSQFISIVILAAAGCTLPMWVKRPTT